MRLKIATRLWSIAAIFLGLWFCPLWNLVQSSEKTPEPSSANRSNGSDTSAAESCGVEVALTGAIGSLAFDRLERSLAKAESHQCKFILVTINTPGGSLVTTRKIVEVILASETAFLCLVAPQGGHAGSAGAIILQACHLNGALESTNLGAATPVSSSGEVVPEDMRKKLINDTVSWVEGLAQLRGRNTSFAREIITEAKAVSAKEAKELGAIDFVGTTKSEFLDFATKKPIALRADRSVSLKMGEIYPLDFGWRDRALELLTDPQFSYLLFMGSLGLIYFEITHPGTMVAGVVGGIGLVISLIAFHKLDVSVGGLLLLLLGIALLVAEAFLPSFGVFGVGGIVAFVLGSLFLFDPEKTGGQILPLATIIAASSGLALIFLVLGWLSLNTVNLRKKTGGESLIGQNAVVVEVFSGGKSGWVKVAGETWIAKSDYPLEVDKNYIIHSRDNLTLNLVHGRKS